MIIRRISPRWTVFFLLLAVASIAFLYQHPVKIFEGQLQIPSEVNSRRFVKIDSNKRDVIRRQNPTTGKPFKIIRTSNISDQNPTTGKPINIYEYIEEKPAGFGTQPEEMARFKRFLATQGAVCQDNRRIGGERSETWLAPRPYGADGAWDVCFDEDVGLKPGSCVVYSFGIGRDFSFDDAMAHYGCHVFSFDPTIGQADHKRSSGVQFFNIGLSTFDQEGGGNISKNLPRSLWKTRTLASVINELGHEKRFIDIVKMDIEGDEWRCLRQMMEDGTLRRYVRQLNIELHVVFQTPQRLREFYSIVRLLHRQGIRVSSLHQNPYCPPCLEMTFINTRLRNLRREVHRS